MPRTKKINSFSKTSEVIQNLNTTTKETSKISFLFNSSSLYNAVLRAGLTVTAFASLRMTAGALSEGVGSLIMVSGEGRDICIFLHEQVNY